MARAPRSAGKMFFEEMQSNLNEMYNNGYFFWRVCRMFSPGREGSELEPKPVVGHRLEI